ncbi:glycosyltransferase family 25 protein [Parashewanella tropica]|uniref:glycosyltransferase family 25 protein n=1 Tax=Parashewanella tropica TaxID=2547970 RepID=UPI00105AB02F|nr:glycosyltransferase family 25 protein [Parashewanella tropica]
MQPTIYVVNMPASKARWQHLQQQLSQLGLQGTRFNAVVGSALSSSEIEAIYDPLLNKQHHKRNLTVGEIGCYASHRQIWQQLLDSGDPYAIVLEDDINLSADFPAIVSSIEQLQHWDLIKLSDNRNNPPAECTSISDNISCVSYKRVPNCTTGYVISRQGAQKLLSRQRFFRPVDVDMQFHSELKLRLIGLLPYCVCEAGFDSEIVAMNPNKRHGNRSTFWRNVKFRLRLMRQRLFQSASLNEIIRPSN